MAWTVLDAAADAGAVETAISDWESSTNPSAVDQIELEQIGSNRVLITVVYTA